MIQFAALIRETVLEALSSKVLVGFLIIAGLALVILLITINLPDVSTTIRSLQPTPEIPDDGALREFVREWQTRVAGTFYNAVVLIATFITASIIPSMMQKGLVDLYLSKPLSRTKLLLGKAAGGLLVVIICVVFFIAVAWLIISAKTGVWNTGFLLSMMPILVSFLSMFSILVFVGVTTGSGALSMIVVYVTAIMISTLLYSRETFLFQFISSEGWRAFFDVLYVLVPQVHGATEIAASYIQDRTVTSYGPMYQALGVSLVFFTLATRSFRRKEF